MTKIAVGIGEEFPADDVRVEVMKVTIHENDPS